jgi:hypothetical protein
MAKVMAFIDTLNSSGTVIKQQKIPVISSKVKREGRRAVDTAEIMVSGNFQSEQNYDLKYIQDIVDAENLSFIANYQQTARDEAGYDIWEHATNGSVDYEKEGSGNNIKFRNRFVADFNGTSEYIEYTNPVTKNPSPTNVIDLSADFDIFVWFKRISGESSNSEHCLFSKWDNGGSGNGLELFYKVGNFSSTDDHIILRVRNNGTTASDIISANPSSSPVHGSFTDWTLVRVKRTAGVISISVGGTNTHKPLTQHVTSNNSTSFDNTQPMKFGVDYTSSAKFAKCRIAQTRIYIGGCLSDTDANTVFGAIPQFFTTKIRGRVWKVEDKLKNKMLHLRGTGKFFLETDVDSRTTSDGGIWSSSQASWELSTRTGNFFQNQVVENIIHDMVRSADNDFRVHTDLSIASETIAKFVASGRLVQLIQLLNLMEQNNADFFTYPHKVLIIEDPAKILTGQVFVHGENGVTIDADKKDNVSMINDITLIGANLPAHFVEPNLTGVTGTTHSLDFRPIGATRVVKNSTQLSEVDSDQDTSINSSEFKVDVENKTIIFGTALSSGDNVQIEYDREPANMISRKKSDSSKSQYGIFAKILNVPQIRTTSASGSTNKGLDWLGDRIISKNKDVERSYTVRVPTLLNGIREGIGIYIANPLKRYNFTTATLYDEKGDSVSGTTAKLPIKAIEWRYPEAVTIMKVGQWEFDYYELLKQSENNLDSIGSTTTKDKFN